MRIGIEAQRLFRAKKHGMDFVALELIKALQRIDRVNEYFIFVNEGPDRCLQERPNFRILEFPGWYPVWEQIKLPKKCRELKLDILHCTSNLAPIFINVPMVVTVHDIIYLEGTIFLKKGFTLYQRFGNIYRKLLAPHILKKAKKIITVSYSERKRLKALPGAQPGKISVVYNAVGPHFSKRPTAEEQAVIKRRYSLPDRYILFLGNTDPKKNTANTLKAFLKFVEQADPEVKLVLADMEEKQVIPFLGESKWEYYKEKIALTGYISNQDMPSVVSQVMLFLYPSERESFGIPLLEAMSQGVPVITSCAYSMPEVAGDAAELVDPNDLDEIAESIQKLYENKRLRHELISKGYDRVKDFNWERSAQQVLEIYSQSMI